MWLEGSGSAFGAEMERRRSEAANLVACIYVCGRGESEPFDQNSC